MRREDGSTTDVVEGSLCRTAVYASASIRKTAVTEYAECGAE
jgi:hypothetical protein